MPTNKLIDPLYAKQWHLKALGGNIEKIWSEYDGSGVHTAIYDTGIDKNHEDLKGGYDASLELIINGARANPSVGDIAHGTAVAGLIVGQANGVGGVGVSYGSTLTAVNIFNGVAGKNTVEAVKQMAKFDTVNNSWNWGSAKYADNTSQKNSFGDQFIGALAGAAETGRNTLGTIIVNSAGNGWATGHIDTNTAEFSQSRHTITVGALGQDGNVASYSNRGASLLVSAPSSEGTAGLTTTDVTGVSGYQNGNYTSTFGGTSAAAPVVTGVVNLMLDANQGLGWRDVQSILAITAEHTGTATLKGEVAGRMAFGWTINAADNVNGGGLHYSNDVGFGRVDAFEAVRFAEVWSQFSASQTSTNEAHVTAQDKAALAIDGSAQFSFHVGDAIALEHADLTLTLTHPNVADLRIELVSPEGTTTILQDAGGSAFAAKDWTWTFGSEALRGEVSKGDWTVRIVDTNGGAAGELKSFSFGGYGSAETAGDVYHFTSDFAEALTLDAGRGLIKDVDGGIDWINAAGLTTNAVVDLRAGAKSDLGAGARFSVGESVIENAITGDGNDTIYGNGGANQLMGMRGNDVLLGLAGNDTLMGGAGADTLVGGLGDDLLVGGDGNDLFVFGAADFGNDVIQDFEIGGDKIDFRGWDLSFSDLEITWTGTAQVLSLSSQKGTISFANLTGQLGLSDFFFGKAPKGGSLDQRDSDGAGADEGAAPVSGQPEAGTPVSLPPAPPEEPGTEPGAPASGDVGSGPGRQAVKNTFSATDFVLAKGDLNLFLTGTAINGEGNDLNNKIVGTEGDNILIGNAGDDSLYGGGGADTLSGGAGSDKLYGQDGNDILDGGANADTLDGGTGADVMRGGAGADKYVVDDIGDVVDEVYGQDVDDGAVDSVTASVDFTLGRFVENLTLIGNARAGTGNDLANKIMGNDADNVIIGNAGNDSLYGGGGADTLSGGAGNDKLYGQDGNDILDGGANADTLDGGTGADVMRGGAGADKYVVDDIGDVVDEVYGQDVDDGAVDSVTASVDFTLGRFVEDLTLTGNARAGTGNDLANKITGNDADNVIIGNGGDDKLYGGKGDDVLRGGDGDDKLYGQDGNDILEGGAGADTLDGGTGADVMRGGAGADKYVVDDLGDVVDETYGQDVDDGAVDSVTASVDFTLARYVENLTLTGKAKIGIGNDLANKITGNDADNRLEGGAGNDTLSGGGGRDVLYGGAGKDVLTGGAGADVFAFTQADATSTDRITDFSAAAGDRIGIDASGFGLSLGQGLDAQGALMADWFEVGTTASKGHAEFFYNAKSKTLYWDADGKAGQEIAVASFSNPVDLTHHSFVIV